MDKRRTWCFLALAVGIGACGTPSGSYLRTEVLPLAQAQLRCPARQIQTACLGADCYAAEASGCGQTAWFKYGENGWTIASVTPSPSAPRPAAGPAPLLAPLPSPRRPALGPVPAEIAVGEVPSFDLLAAHGDEEWEKVASLLRQLPATRVPVDKATFSRVVGEEQALLERSHQRKSIASLILADAVDRLITERQLEKTRGSLGSTLDRTAQNLDDVSRASEAKDFSRVDSLNRELAINTVEIQAAMLLAAMAPEQATLDRISAIRSSLSAEWSAAISDPGRGTPADRLLLWKWLRLRFESDPEKGANQVPFAVVGTLRPEIEVSPAVREEVALLLGGLNAVRARSPLPTAPTTPTGAVVVTKPGERAALTYLDETLETLRV